MIKPKRNLCGKVFGKLTVTEQDSDYVSPKGSRLVRWKCRCECGKEVSVSQSNLVSGHTSSCGCYQREKAIICGHGTKKHNKYDLSGTYGIGWTSNTNQEFYFELDRYDEIKDYCWCETKYNGFRRLSAYNPDTGKNIRMHILLGYKNHDHIDRNELNNLKSNLRPCSHQENIFNRGTAVNNTSGITGVYWNKSIGKWTARIKIDKKSIALGSYTNLDDAVKARLNAEKQYFGEFAPQQHLFEKYDIDIFEP